MRVLHVNFAKGFRGGERQTELLIRALAGNDIQQGLLVREDSPLIDKLADVDGLEVVTTRKPYIRASVSPQLYDLVQAHETKAAQWAFLNYKRNNTPYVITRRVPNRIKNNFFSRGIYHNARVTVCLSEEIKFNLLTTAPKAKTQIIADMCGDLAVNTAFLQKITDRYAGKRVVGTAGALVKKHKGQHVLIEAARKLQECKDLHFLILGEGYDRAELELQAEGLSNVEFLGFQQEIAAYLRLFDIFAFPSLVEGMGSTLLDAMQAKTPIVASNVGGIPEIVTDAEDGLLVEPGDTDSLKAAIQSLLDDPVLAKKLVQTALQTVEKFKPEPIAGQYYALYKQNLNMPSKKIG